MIGSAVTLVRVKDLGREGKITFTTKGRITENVHNDDGKITGICVIGGRVEDGAAVHSWFSVCPEGCAHDQAAREERRCNLRGSLLASQTMTLDACGHTVAYDCDCDTIAAEAADQDRAVHLVSATQIVTATGQHVLAMCGADMGPYAEAARLHPVGNYTATGSPAWDRITCQGCKSSRS